MKAGRRILESLGYRVVFRRHGWTECLAWRGQERWLGQGGDEGQALEAVFAQMFPSFAARQLVEKFEAQTDRTPSGSGDTAPAFSVEDRIYSRSEALTALENLAERIDIQQPDLAMMSPLRQRMVMLAWICRARTWEDRRPDDSFVARQVATIARKITLLGKLWWPGSVRSLHVNSTPADAAAEADMDGTWPARTWSDAAALVNDRTRRLFAGDADDERDTYGWRDHDALAPPPANADALLARIADELARRVGSLQEPARNFSRGGYAPRAGDYEDFSEWAKKLRWLRGSARDFATWGAAIGRLRWLALQNGSQRSELSEWLDPDFRPSTPWSDAHPNERAAAGHTSPDTLVVAVRRHVEGMRALVVEGTCPGQTSGAEIHQQLESTFGLSVSDQGLSKQAIDQAVAQLQKDPTDLVIFLTCFEDFEADAQLAAAARAGQIPYVRLFASHPLSSARAIAHQLGLDPAH